MVRQFSARKGRGLLENSRIGDLGWREVWNLQAQKIGRKPHGTKTASLGTGVTSFGERKSTGLLASGDSSSKPTAMRG